MNPLILIAALSVIWGGVYIAYVAFGLKAVAAGIVLTLCAVFGVLKLMSDGMGPPR
jgi:hypothetical protein